MDIVSIAYIDREMTSKEFGRKNIVTKKQDTINEVTGEARKVAFRSSAYVLDSKSRFPDIVDEVPLNANAFVKAIQDAINHAAEMGFDIASSSEYTLEVVTKPEPVYEDYSEDVTSEDEIVADDEVDTAIPFDVDDTDGEEVDLESLCNSIRDAFRSADATAKKSVKAVLVTNGATKLDVSIGETALKEIAKILNV